MDIGRTFSYVTEDERWVTKVLIGGLVGIIPIVGQLAVMGYMFKVAQNVARGSERPLPEWGEFGDLIMRGLYGLVISLVYFIPYIVLAILFSCVTGGLGAAAENSDSAGSLVGGLACLFVPLMLIFAIGGAILAWGGYARYIATGQLSEAFKFGEVVALIRNNINLWLMMLVVGLLSGVVASLGIIACGVGVLFTSFYAYLMQGHALGQVVAQIYPSGGVTDPPASYTPPTVQL
jgi:hypothetical protein